jgi:hypothetical protein
MPTFDPSSGTYVYAVFGGRGRGSMAKVRRRKLSLSSSIALTSKLG